MDALRYSRMPRLRKLLGMAWVVSATAIVPLAAASKAFVDDVSLYEKAAYVDGTRIFGSDAEIYYLDLFGNESVTSLTLYQWIDGNDGSRLGANTQTRTASRYRDTISAAVRYPVCYRARAIAAGPPNTEGTEMGTSQLCADLVGPTQSRKPPTIIVTCETGSPDCPSPIVLNLGRGGYRLTDVENGVRFDLDADGGAPDLVSWTAAGEALAFLAFDRNGNGSIDDGRELFGNFTPLRNGRLAANGFEALAEFDSNRDAVVDDRDSAWSKLLLWIDSNHDGLSAPDEITSTAESEVRGIETAYRWTGRRDRYGNLFKYEGRTRMASGNRVCYDIFFRAAPGS
jgi:hypothetical protein